MASATLPFAAPRAGRAGRIDSAQARYALCAALLAAALLLGGGGSPAPRAELAVELAAIAAAAAWFALPAQATVRRDMLVLTGGLAFASVPLLQLLPLPPQLWQALPGRETEVAALALAGMADRWMPLSLTSARTLASALSLIAPLAVLFFVARMPIADRTKLLGVVLAAAVLSAVIGAVQLASGSAGTLRFYGSSGFSYASGLFANRNANADLLLIGLFAMLALTASQTALLRAHSARLAWGASALFLLLSVVLTRSRAGILLAAIPLALAPVLLRPWLRDRRRLSLATAAVAVALAAGVAALHGNPALQRSWDRFALAADNRADLRTDTLHAIANSWPVGTGLGSFVPVFGAAERLETVDATLPNRAHNEYFEFALETGALAPLLLLGTGSAIAWRATRLLRAGAPAERRPQMFFALGTLAIFVLHALVDYPMRVMALACVAALAIGMLADPPQPEQAA
jgi:O-antigen ligase